MGQLSSKGKLVSLDTRGQPASPDAVVSERLRKTGIQARNHEP